MGFLLQLTGSFAQPCDENPTVAIVEAAYQYHELPWRYINCEVAPDALGDAVRGARAMGWAGFNCSLPHKITVIPYLDSLGESASIIGAVNCVVDRNGEWIGENTDGRGFLQAIEGEVELGGSRIVVFGAGGAARAIAVEAALAGAAHITIVNRSLARGKELVRLIKQRTKADASFVPAEKELTIPEETHILVNATSLGLFPHTVQAPRVHWESLDRSALVADVVANPRYTSFLQLAESRGHKIVDGQSMLVNQAVLAIKHWTGVDVSPVVMKATLQKIFAPRIANKLLVS